MRTDMPVRFETATEDVWVMGASIEIDENGLATEFTQILEPAG
jgi:hypothetical protein